MDIARKAILVMQALGAAGSGASTGGSKGVLVVEGPEHDALDALRLIVETLDQRIDVFDSDRTNLNDLDVLESPLSQKAAFNARSTCEYMTVLRGWVPGMADDPRVCNFRRRFARGGPVVILSSTAEGVPNDFVLCDLSAWKGSPR